ncbi:MAG: helix-turn-helix domain-containing protein, partial [Frankiales bacterium]|nr:helix-turn-helix domain-containing protein [Frankiales bacterium]
TGRRRAEQGMPLESVLHAYRLGYRIIWEGLVTQARADGSLDGLVEAATEVWMIVDEFSSIVADSYRETEAEFARRDDRRRDALLDALLEGRGAERTLTADAAAALDLPEHGRFVVVVSAGEDGSCAAGSALRDKGLQVAWRTRSDREIGLVSLGRADPADVVSALQTRPGLRAGVSPAVDGLAEVDVAHRLAETALRALPAGESIVAELDARLPGALLVTAPDLAARLVRRALGGVLDLERDERTVLLDTLRAWLDTGGSAGQTAGRLYCHRNTVLNRLRRVEGLTDRSLERVDHLVEWSLALLALDVLAVARAPEA